MWVLLNDCFFSIVSKDCARDELLVRARRSGDIEKLWPKAKVIRAPKSDYLFRAVIKRSDIASAMAVEVLRISYSNFKDSVGNAPLKMTYSRIWSELSLLQPTVPFSGARRK